MASNYSLRYIRERTTCVYQKRHIRMFIPALFIIVKTQKIQMFINKKMDKLWHIDITEYFAGITRNKLLTHTET